MAGLVSKAARLASKSTGQSQIAPNQNPYGEAPVPLSATMSQARKPPAGQATAPTPPANAAYFAPPPPNDNYPDPTAGQPGFNDPEHVSPGGIAYKGLPEGMTPEGIRAAAAREAAAQASQADLNGDGTTTNEEQAEYARQQAAERMAADRERAEQGMTPQELADRAASDLLRGGPRDTAEDEAAMRAELAASTGRAQQDQLARMGAMGMGTSGALGLLSGDLQARAARQAASGIQDIRQDARDEYLRELGMGLSYAGGDRGQDLQEERFADEQQRNQAEIDLLQQQLDEISSESELTELPAGSEQYGARSALPGGWAGQYTVSGRSHTDESGKVWVEYVGNDGRSFWVPADKQGS